MNSPFPGMDPYLEQPGAWHDFHEQFCMECRAMLVPRLGSDYFAKLDDHDYIHELAANDRRLLGRSDISAASDGSSEAGPNPSTATISAPVVGHVELEFDLERESSIEIRDRESQRLVTVIELLSPANKRPGGDREAFLAKRREILNSDVHLIEIDLLRGWQQMPVADLPECDYCVMVSRSESRPAVGLWPFRLRDELPKIPVPLSRSDEEVELDLSAAFRTAFDSAEYGRYIYRGTPDPPLSSGDESWATELLRTEGIQTP